MKKIQANDAGATYRQRPVAALYLAAICLIALVLAILLDLPVVARLSLGTLTVVCTVVGLSSETLELDFHSDMLRYETRFAGWVTQKIEDEFRSVQAVSVYGTAGERDAQIRPTAPPGLPATWHVVLNYAGKRRVGILVGAFASEAEALLEAQFLATHMKITLDVLARQA